MSLVMGPLVRARTIALTVALLLAPSSCAVAAGSGIVVTETREATGFSRIELATHHRGGRQVKELRGLALSGSGSMTGDSLALHRRPRRDKHVPIGRTHRANRLNKPLPSTKESTSPRYGTAA
jgi:hypothetical protein